MAKQNKNSYLWIGISVIAVVILAIVLISNSNNNSQNEREELTEKDFKILDIYWDDTIYWDKLCEGYLGNFLTAGYKIVTYQTKDELLCNLIIDGKDYAYYDANLGKTYSAFLKEELIHKGYNNVDASKNHNFEICCISNYIEGEICDSMTLRARC